MLCPDSVLWCLSPLRPDVFDVFTEQGGQRCRLRAATLLVQFASMVTVKPLPPPPSPALAASIDRLLPARPAEVAAQVLHAGAASASPTEEAAQPAPAALSDALAAAVELLIPAGASNLGRVHNAMARFLARLPSFTCSHHEAACFLRATFSASLDCRDTVLRQALTAPHSNAFEVFAARGDQHYRLRAAALLQAAPMAGLAPRAAEPPLAAAIVPLAAAIVPLAAETLPRMLLLSPLAAAIDRVLPVGPAEEHRVLNALAHFLSARLAFSCSSAAAIAHLCAVFPGAAHWRSGRLQDLVAARPDVLEHFNRDGEATYRLRAALLLQATMGLSRASAVEPAAPPLPRVVAAAPPPAALTYAIDRLLPSQLSDATRPPIAETARGPSAGAAAPLPVEDAAQPAPAALAAALAAAIELLIPAGTSAFGRVQNAMARLLARLPSFTCSHPEAACFLRATFSASLDCRDTVLSQVLAARWDAFDVFSEQGEQRYRLRAAALLLRTSAPAAIHPLMQAPKLSQAHLIRLVAAAQARWGPRGPRGAIHLRAAVAMMDPARNEMAPLALPGSGELVFACSYRFLGAPPPHRFPRAAHRACRACWQLFSDLNDAPQPLAGIVLLNTEGVDASLEQFLLSDAAFGCHVLDSRDRNTMLLFAARFSPDCSISHVAGPPLELLDGRRRRRRRSSRRRRRHPRSRRRRLPPASSRWRRSRW
jgi:hypothetical protein